MAQDVMSGFFDLKVIFFITGILVVLAVTVGAKYKMSTRLLLRARILNPAAKVFVLFANE